MNGDLYFDGEKYISVKRAAEISGYTDDYIGQLCRFKKLKSRMVGRSWFISEISLFEYFDKQKHEAHAISSSRDDNNGGSGEFVYMEDKRPLFPDVSEKVATPIIDAENSIGETKKDIPGSVDKSPLCKKSAGHNLRPMLRTGAMMAALVLIAGALENFSFTKESYKNISSLSANFLKEIASQSGSEKSVDFKGRDENKVLALIEKTPLYFEAGLRSSVDRVASAYHSFASGFDIADNNFNFAAFQKNASSFLNKAKLALGGHSGLKYFSAAAEASLKEKSLSSINDFSLKIYNGTNNLFSGVKNYFGGFFDGKNKFAENEIVIIKKPSSDRSSSSVSSAKAALATLSPNSSESATYNPASSAGGLQPTTYNLIQSDITRKEVLDLIKQYDDNSKALIYAANAANGENSLTISQSVSGLEKRISNLQYINSRQLDKPASVLSRSDADIKNISGVSVTDSTITSSSFSGTTGTFSGNLTVGSQLAVSGTATSTIAGDASFDSGTLYIDSINNRVGIGTTSPYAKLSVVGPVAAEYFHATSTTATSTFSGQTVAGFAPTLAHSFGSWSVGASGANPLGASFIINPSSATSDSNLLSLSVNGSAKFLVDAEGDIFANAVTVVGGTTLSTTTASTFTVEGNTYLGDATTTDITYFNSRIADSLIPTADNLLDLGDSANWLRWRTGYFGTSVGIGGTATSTGTQLTTSGAYLIDSNNTLSINTTNNKAVSFGTGNISLPYASTTALTVSSSAYIGSLNGPLQANNGLVSATTSVGALYGGTGLDSSALTGIAQIVSGTWSASSTLSTAFGGTGWNSIQSNSILLGNGAGRLATTSAGTDGYVLALSAGVPTWLATSTLSTITGTLAVGKGGTGQTSFGQGWLNSDGTTLSASTSPTVNYITATSTTATSTFPYLSITTNSNLGTVVGGTWQGTAIGDAYLTKSGDWTGTLDTYNGSDLLARANHTGTQGVSTLSNYDWTFSNNYGAINLTGSSTKPLWAQGGINASSTSNFVYASTTALTVSGNSYLGTVSSGTWNGTAIGNSYIDDDITLTNLTQITNRAITDTTGTLTVARGGTGQTSFGQGWLNSDGTTLSASTSPTVNYITATSTTATSTFPYLSVTTNSNLGTVVGGTWQGTAVGDTYLTKSGDWTGTLDTYNGSDLLARANHTGTQGVSTLSNYDWTFSNNYGAINLTGTSTKPIWAQGGINASSTSNFVYASTTALTATNLYPTNLFATILQGDITGNSKNITGLNQLTASDSISIGANSASTGALRFANTGLLTFRNQANTADINAIQVYTDDVLYLGYNNSAIQLRADSGSIMVLDNGKVGIGDDTPDNLLEVLSSGVANTQLSIGNTNAGDYDPQIGFELVDGTNTFTMGIDDSDSDKFKISTTALGTNDRFVIDSSGNIGIGTSSPYAKLSVVGETVSSYFTATSTTATSTFAGGMNVAGTAGLTVLQNGNVGVGTAAPNSKLHIVGADATTQQITFRSSDANWLGRLGQTVNNDSLGVFLSTAGNWTVSQTTFNATKDYNGGYPTSALFISNDFNGVLGPRFSFLSKAGGATLTDGAVTELMTINSSGNVGIGTTSPNSKLTVYNGSADSAIEFSSASGDTYKWTIGMDYSDGGKFKIASSTALGTVDRFTIDGNGNIGIGTTSPYAKLSVVGETVSSYFTATSTTATSTFAGGMNVAGTAGLTVLQNGNVGVGTASPASKLQVGAITDATISAYDIVASQFGVQNNIIFGNSGGGISAVGGDINIYNGKLVVNFSGNVGIGTTTPNSKLTVYNGSADSAIEFSSASGDTYKWTMGMDYSDAGKFKIASSTALGTLDKFTIDGSGYVGIGTSTPARRLDVVDVSNPQLRLSQGTTVYTDFSVAPSTGDLTLSLYPGATADDILLTTANNTGANLWVCENSTCPSGITFSGGGNLFVEGVIKYATSTTPKTRRSIILTAAGAIVPVASGAAKTQVDGTNHSYYVLDYDTSSDEAAFWQWTMPDSYDDGTIDITYYWEAGAISGNATFCFQAKGLSANSSEDIDSALSSAVCKTDAAQANANDLASITETNATSNFTAGEYVTFKVFRDVDNGDDMTGDARLVKVKIEYGVATESD